MDLIGTRFEIRRYNAGANTHSHNHHQVVIPLEGTLEMDIDGRTGAATGTTAALVPAGARHSFTAGPDSAFLIMDIAEQGTSSAVFHGPVWDAASSRPFLSLDRRFSHLCEFLAGEVSRYGSQGMDTAGDMLVTALGRRMGIEGDRFEPGLAKALRFIETHYGEDISVNRVAHAAGLSTSRLHAQFRARLQTSPKRYIASCRLKHAAQNLAQSQRPIAEIAFHAGYGDQSAFTRAFKRVYAQSPARFRRMAQDQDKRHKLQ